MISVRVAPTWQARNETDFAEAEAVEGWEDERKDLEECVVDSIEEGGIHINEEDSGVLDSNLDGLDESIDKNARDSWVTLINLTLSWKSIVSCQLSETLRSSQ